MYKYFGSHEDTETFDEINDYFENNLEKYPIEVDIVKLIMFNLD